jgi:hypothetical protein
VRVPARAALVFAWALNATAPLPLPLAPDVIVIHGALLVAVHVQSLPAVTVTDPAFVDADTETLVELSV